MPSIFSTDIIDSHKAKVPSKYTTFTERWYLLLAGLLLNFSFGSLCTCLLPIPNAALNIICNANSTLPNCVHLHFWIWVSYPIGFLLGAIPSVLLIIKIGNLPSLYIAFIAGLLSVSIRFVGLFVQEFVDWRYMLILISHGIHALAHPIGLILAPTISHYWFPCGQRTLATSLIISGYFLGLLSSFVLTPNIVDENNTLKDLINLTYINYAFAILPFVPLISVWRNKPLIAPSASADDSLVNRRCKQPQLFNSTTMVHCLLFASFAGAIRFTMQLHNQILCLHGYLFKFSGLHALILMGSTIGSVILSGITDTIYNHKQIYKISFAIVTIASCILSLANSTDSKQIFIFMSLILLGFFGVGLYNIAIEMAIESSFPVNPSKIATLMFASGYTGELVYILVAIFARRTAKKSPYPVENCQSHGNLEDYSSTQIIITMVLLIFFLLTLICLKWAPGRKEHELHSDNLRINSVLTSNPLGSGELRTRC